MNNQKSTPISRLLWALLIMLGFAGIELTTGALLGLMTLTADGLDMLGHSGLLALALAVQFIAARLPELARARTESYGGLAIAGYLFIMAVILLISGGHGGHGGHDHHGHHMAPEYGGVVIMAFAALSIIIHASTGKLLYGGKCHPLVLGACVYIFSHTFMAIAMFGGGLLMSITGMHSIDQYLTLGIALFMGAGAGKLGYLSYRRLRQANA